MRKLYGGRRSLFISSWSPNMLLQSPDTDSPEFAEEYSFLICVLNLLLRRFILRSILQFERWLSDNLDKKSLCLLLIIALYFFLSLNSIFYIFMYVRDEFFKDIAMRCILNRLLSCFSFILQLILVIRTHSTPSLQLLATWLRRFCVCCCDR